MSNIYNEMRKPKDECYTKPEDAKQLVEYLVKHKVVKKNAKIWLPFGDDKHSAIYDALKEAGFTNLIATTGDFYETSVQYDIIISNPPFSKRTKLFEKLMELNKPFILLQPVQMFNNHSVIELLCNKKFGFICPEKRMSFTKNKQIAFYSFWLCYKTKIRGFKDER